MRRLTPYLVGTLAGCALAFAVTAARADRPARPWLARYAPTEAQWADLWLRANCSYVGTGVHVQARTETNFTAEGKSIRNAVIRVDHLKKVKKDELELAKGIAKRCEQEFEAEYKLKKPSHGDFSWAFPVSIETKEID